MRIVRFVSIGFLIGFLLSQFSCGASAQKYENSRDYEVEDFTRIHLEGGYRVHLKQGEKAALTIEVSDADAFDYYDVESDFSALRITMKERYFSFERITLHITFRELDELHIEGGVKLKTRGYLDVNDLDIKVEGGANMDLRVKADHLTLVGEGGMLIELVGVANKLKAKMSGAAHLDASELEAREVSVSIEGVGTGSVYATKELWASIEGVGKIKYRGEPRVHKSIDGLGTVSED
jgi:hypothetical protein